MVEVDVAVEAAGTRLGGRLTAEPEAPGLVVFAHADGSSRHGSRHQAVARTLNRAGLSTLLVDLLTPEEERVDRATGRPSYDIDLLTGRLTGVVDWLGAREDARGLPIGLHGVSTGAAAALGTAADRPDMIGAVVSRGGRADLAGSVLYRVRAPTLFIVGGADTAVRALNDSVADRVNGPVRVHVVPNATHLSEEPGTLDEAAEAAADWFTRALRADEG